MVTEVGLVDGVDGRARHTHAHQPRPRQRLVEVPAIVAEDLWSGASSPALTTPKGDEAVGGAGTGAAQPRQAQAQGVEGIRSDLIGIGAVKIGKRSPGAVSVT